MSASDKEFGCLQEHLLIGAFFILSMKETHYFPLDFFFGTEKARRVEIIRSALVNKNAMIFFSLSPSVVLRWQSNWQKKKHQQIK